MIKIFDELSAKLTRSIPFDSSGITKLSKSYCDFLCTKMKFGGILKGIFLKTWPKVTNVLTHIYTYTPDIQKAS